MDSQEVDKNLVFHQENSPLCPQSTLEQQDHKSENQPAKTSHHEKDSKKRLPLAPETPTPKECLKISNGSAPQPYLPHAHDAY